MKRYFYLMVCLLLATLSACEKHDFFDENVITGNVGPQAYWEIESSTVSAGSNMLFDVQYYSAVADIDHSEVWYNIIETQEKAVSCPWVTTFTYAINSVNSEEKRISQKIQEYPHALAVWSDSLHAYIFTAGFPVSGTLSPFSWSKPETFESDKMEMYFGAGFMDHFKDSLQTKMKFADYKNMMLGLSLLEDFKQYTDSTFDANSDSYVYHFSKDAGGNTPVPAAITTLYNGITFDRLIEGASGYNVEFKRTYSMEAILRVYDKRGVFGTTVSKKIDIN
ncbi:hypothetical protein AGMMS49525_17100 [Bacteroidia bacterium]|nr:hypothetical protein AGMMS49525_17100 [Bacteroidia bacterium]